MKTMMSGTGAEASHRAERRQRESRARRRGGHQYAGARPVASETYFRTFELLLPAGECDGLAAAAAAAATQRVTKVARNARPTFARSCTTFRKLRRAAGLRRWARSHRRRRTAARGIDKVASEP
ncbi:hypothetical protein EVAR_4405_1 [Eumeta japonica]|uniref:Uncharacterized protein n=1 Tax=Eumeta variegata TaxID=151549 RepID=A0A4C1SYG0_EUMVA|nr:hypothetical protein EVAR_4405_1 [Eumeta japonica]